MWLITLKLSPASALLITIALAYFLTCVMDSNKLSYFDSEVDICNNSVNVLKHSYVDFISQGRD
jgi:hypothetical protein